MHAANGYSGDPMTAVELMSAVVSYVLELASSKVPAIKDGTAEVKYVLTFPADFDFGRRNLLMQAFNVAGVSIDDIDSMHDEATSACVGYMHKHNLFDGKHPVSRVVPEPLDDALMLPCRLL
jgi:molecular chaperone DnaK (HSP70)